MSLSDLHPMIRLAVGRALLAVPDSRVDPSTGCSAAVRAIAYAEDALLRLAETPEHVNNYLLAMDQADATLVRLGYMERGD